MIIIAETHEENELVAKLAKEHSCQGYAREDAFGLTVWSVDDLKSKHPDISDADALSFLENYENRLREGSVSGGWDFLDYADFSQCPSLNKEELPEFCYGTSSTGELIIITRGKPGYTPAPSGYTDKEKNEKLAEEHNAEMGISKAQVSAMFVGSLFGWDVPGADPANYGEDGKLLCPGEKASLDAQISVAQAKTNEKLQEPKKTSLDEKISMANIKKTDNAFAWYPSIAKIKEDYSELMEQIKDIRTIDAAKEYAAKYPVEIEINGVSVDDFVHSGGTDKDIEWIRYESYGCLSYVYDRFDGKPMFDVAVSDGFYEFVHDIRIDDLTEANYRKWVDEDRESFSPSKDDELEI